MPRSFTTTKRQISSQISAGSRVYDRLLDGSLFLVDSASSHCSTLNNVSQELTLT